MKSLAYYVKVHHDLKSSALISSVESVWPCIYVDVTDMFFNYILMVETIKLQNLLIIVELFIQGRFIVLEMAWLGLGKFFSILTFFGTVLATLINLPHVLLRVMLLSLWFYRR